MAFKMKGNPYKMGQMATKSALKQTEKPSRKDLSMEDKWKTDLTPEQKERIEERMKEMGKGEAKKPKKREFDVPQGEDARGKSPVKQKEGFIKTKEEKKFDISDEEMKRISDAFKKTKIRKEGPGKLDKKPKTKGKGWIKKDGTKSDKSIIKF
mgnify:FL=1